MTTSLHPRPVVRTVNWEGQSCLPPAQVPQDWNGQLDPNAAHAFRIACPPDPVRLGLRSARFELRKTDSSNVSGSTRAELSARFREPVGTTCWYGFSIYLPNSWAHDQSGENLTQWHQADQDPKSPTPKFDGSPPLALMTKNGKWWISTRENTWDNQVSELTDDKDVGNYDHDIGVWTDWVVSVVWSPVATGMIRVWKNGRTVYHRQGIQTKFSDGKENYVKFGIYKWDWAQGKPSITTERSMFYDELRISGERGSWLAVSPDRKWWLDWFLDLMRTAVLRIVRR
jgi:hypothetical protein